MASFEWVGKNNCELVITTDHVCDTDEKSLHESFEEAGSEIHFVGRDGQRLMFK